MSDDTNPYEYPNPAPELAEQREARERAACPACCQKRLHTDEDWKHHPHARQARKAGQ